MILMKIGNSNNIEKTEMACDIWPVAMFYSFFHIIRVEIQSVGIYLKKRRDSMGETNNWFFQRPRHRPN